jgi:hypothetical protein
LEEGARITHEMKEKVGLEETTTPQRKVAPAAPTSPAGTEAAPRSY